MVPNPIVLLGLGTEALAACPSPPPTSVQLFEQLATAQAAYGALDVPGFRAAMTEVDQTLPCAADEVTRHLAAELHRHQGLRAFLDRDTDRSTGAFAAARAIEPTYKFPVEVVPAGNPVLNDYGAVDPDAGRSVRVPPPLEGRIQLDGEVTEERPVDFPAVVQLFDVEGKVTATGYLWPGDPLPSYTPRPVEALGERPPAARRAPKGMVAGAVVAGIAAGALYGTNYVVYRRYQDPETLPGALDGLYTLNNALVIASGGMAVTAVGLGAGALLVARF
jgi:hypothetical protein